MNFSGVLDERKCDFHIGEIPHYGELILKSLNYYELFLNKPNRNASLYWIITYFTLIGIKTANTSKEFLIFFLKPFSSDSC